MPGDIGHSSQRFRAAVRRLALGDGNLRDRFREAFIETIFQIEVENPRPIPDEVRKEMEAFWERGNRKNFDVMTAPLGEVKTLGAELLRVAELVVKADDENSRRGWDERHRSN